MILENGVVRTMDPALPVARALAIAGDRIAGGVGTHETALPTPDVIDLGGRCVVPGFTDSHVHFPTWSLGQRDLSLDGVRTLAEALDRVRREAGRGDWIRGQGWRSADWEAQPTKEALDAVTGAVPAALWAKDLHSLWLNSAALALAGGDLEVDGGVVERDERGEPTGVLREEAAWRFREWFPSVHEDEWLEVTRAGVKLASSRGVTAVHDKDGWIGAPGIFQRLHEREGLTLRVWQSLPWRKLPELEALGLRSGFGDDYLRLGYLKVFMDGTLGSQTAWMLDGSGVEITSGEELAEIVRRAARAGWPVAVHAIGDRANREVLDIYEAALRQVPVADHRFRVEHAQIIHRQDIPRFAQLGVIPSMQGSHQSSDAAMAMNRVGWTRVQGAYAWRQLLNTGVVIPNGSDFPVERVNPLISFHASLTRQDANGWPAGGWFPDERMSRQEALLSMTLWPAYAAFQEDVLGTLTPGKYADFVVLDQDIMTCAPERILDTRVVMTVLGGRVVYPVGQ